MARVLRDVDDFCRLILFRHPELAPEAEGTAVGSASAPLSRRGTARLVDWLQLLEPVEVHGVFCSPQQHCQDSAAGIALGKGLDPESDDRLRDQELGDWQGRRWDELAHEDPDRVTDFFQSFGEVQAPGGESLGDAVERFLDWWSERRTDSAGKTLCVVASGGMVAGFAAAMLGMRLGRTTSLQLPPGSCGVIDVYGNGVRISSWNPTAFAWKTTGSVDDKAAEGPESRN